MVENRYFQIEPMQFSHKKGENTDYMFSILIVSWNNLECLKLCVHSILKNSSFKHQILIHVNQGSDGTLEWVKEQGYSYTHSKDNVGICFGMNALSSFVEAEYVLLIDDDNYVAPGWDSVLVDEIKKVGHKYFAISSTRLEPYPNTDKTAITPADFGRTPQTFREEEFLQKFNDFQIADWNGSSWYPMVIHRDLWFTIGGLSTEFSPGMGSDPDFMMKLWQAGVRYFKGVSASRAYHFVSRTTGRVKKNNGRKQFALKWGMNMSTFFKYYLHMQEPFQGVIDENESLKNASSKIWFDRFKMRFK